MTLQERLAATAEEVGEAIAHAIPPSAVQGLPLAEARLLDAMRYAVEGGKRLRAFLVVEGARACGVDHACALRVATAVECIHAYSLVHDDLPAMDDDDLRRGRPTVHRAYDEATAILVGDALQTLAFELLAEEETHGLASVRCELVAGLAQASGAAGMVGGQAIDMYAEGADEAPSMPEVTRLQRMKTGALIEFSAVAGAILGRADDRIRRALRAYGRDFGQVFQICDDLLDVEGDEAAAGKALRKDGEAGKATFVSLMGAEDARAQARRLTDHAVEHLAPLGERGTVLAALARYALERRA